MMKIVLDTDIGDDIDDALAVAFAVRRPELDVRAITTVYGRTDLRTRLLAKLLAVLERDDIPIASGRRYPLGSISKEKRRWLDEHIPCQCGFVGEHEEVRVPPFESAEALIQRTIREHNGDIAIVTIGPMTNLGALIRDCPGIVKEVRFIAMMGGCYALNRSEYNVACDPEAAGLVLRAECEKFLGTWEVTKQVVMGEQEMKRLRQINTPLTRALLKLIELWWPHRGHKPGPVLYDISPLIWAFDRGFFGTELVGLDVETEGRYTRGYTVPARTSPPSYVTTDIRAKDVLELFMDTICA